MEIRFYIDAETNEPHIAGHGVRQAEVREVLEAPLEDRQGADEARVAIGQTEGGRYLRVVYVQDTADDSLFVITAYELGAKSRRALRRRLRKRS